MSSVEKFEVSNLDILGVILDVLIVKKVEGINTDAKITESILCFKYIIHLFLTNITDFLKKFEPTYNNLLKSKDSVTTYTSIIKLQKILEKLPEKNINPFISLVAENPFRGFDIDKFFNDEDKFFKDNFNDEDNGIRMKKRGLVYFIKFTPYILLLNHIMETDIDADNIKKLKECIKKYAPNIKTINTFSSFTQQPKKKNPKNIEGLAVPQTIELAGHIDANAAEYIKLNKFIFGLEKKVVAKIEGFQKKGGENTTRTSYFDLFNRSIGEVTGDIESNVSKYSLDMIEEYTALLLYLNEKYIPLSVIEEVSDTMEKQEEKPVPKLETSQVEGDNVHLSPPPSERKPSIYLHKNPARPSNSISSPEAQEEQKYPASDVV